MMLVLELFQRLFSSLAESLSKAYGRYCAVLASRRDMTTTDFLDLVWRKQNGSKYEYGLSRSALEAFDDIACLSIRRGRRAFSPKNQIKSLAQTVLLNQANSSSFGHPFHLVNPSFLPLAFSVSVLAGFHMLLAALRVNSNYTSSFTFFHGFFAASIFAVVFAWVLEAAREEQRGAHTAEVETGFYWAIILFIASEFMLFVSFFWAYFHGALNPSMSTGGFLVPIGLIPFFYWRVPAVNTLLLLSSAFYVTAAHGEIANRDEVTRIQVWLRILTTPIFFGRHSVLDFVQLRTREKTMRNPTVRNWTFFRSWFPKAFPVRSSIDDLSVSASGYAWAESIGWKWKSPQQEELSIIDDHEETGTYNMIVCVLFAIAFLAGQVYEFCTSLFTITDSLYGAVFFSLTGLHGFHVFLGMIFLLGYLIFIANQKSPRWLLLGNSRYFRFQNKLVPHVYSYNFEWWGHRAALDGAVWYWHFVDVVWLFVFIIVYWWSFPTYFLNWCYWQKVAKYPWQETMFYLIQDGV